MNCQETTALLADYCYGNLADAEQLAVEAHLDGGCAGCRQALAQERALRAALRAMPVPPPSRGFLEQAVHRAASTRRPSTARWRAAVGGALAAGVVLGLVATLFLRVPRPTEGIPGVTMALHEARTIQLALNSERELRQATVTIQLPEGVELRGFAGQREISWKTDLARGVNLLSLPLVAVAAKDGALVARLHHDDRNRELRVMFTVHAAHQRDAFDGLSVPPRLG
jgi:anti-sigma factor RsiW